MQADGAQPETRRPRLCIDKRLESMAAEVGPAIDALLATGLARCPGLRQASEVADDVGICLAGILNNWIEHGYGGRPGQPIRLRLLSDVHVTRLEVCDRGARPDPKLFDRQAAAPVPPLDALPERGCGSTLTRGLADRVSLSREGSWNLLAVEKRLG